jgi:hypothetical protein
MVKNDGGARGKDEVNAGGVGGTNGLRRVRTRHVWFERLGREK